MRLQWAAMGARAAGGTNWLDSDREAVQLVVGQRDLTQLVLDWLDTLDEPTAD